RQDCGVTPGLHTTIDGRGDRGINHEVSTRVVRAATHVAPDRSSRDRALPGWRWKAKAVIPRGRADWARGDLRRAWVARPGCARSPRPGPGPDRRLEGSQARRPDECGRPTGLRRIRPSLGRSRHDRGLYPRPGDGAQGSVRPGPRWGRLWPRADRDGG